MERPTLSIVVIGRNEGARLERCLSSVTAVEFPEGRPELIYVDSASKDQSGEVARRNGAEVVFLDANRPTAARARNAGAAKSTGGLILFLDGDTILDPAFVAAATQEFKDPSIAVVWGQRREIYPHKSIFNRVVDLEWMTPPGVSEFCGGDSVMRRSAFEQAGGFDVNLIAGEEPDLCCRLGLFGWTLRHLDIPMTLHDIDMHSFSQYWRRAVRTGYAYAQVSKRYEGSPIPLWKAEARSNQTRAFALTFGFCGSLIWSWAIASVLPSIAALSLFAALVVRTAIKNRWKTSDLSARLLYGIHSHVQQIPICIGQVQFWADARHARTRSLIEYKTTP